MWIFLRTLDTLDENSSVIRVYKENKSKKIFIQFGTFIKENSEELTFFMFSTQQLIQIESKY